MAQRRPRRGGSVGYWIETLEGRRLLSAVGSLVVHTAGSHLSSDVVAASESLEAPLDINALVASGKASVSATASDLGSIQSIFDGDNNSLYRTPAINPAVINIGFTSPKTLTEFRLRASHAGGNPAYRWKVEAAPAGSKQFTEIVPFTGTASDVDSVRRLNTPFAASQLRLTVQRLTGDAYVHLNEFRIFADLSINSLSVTPTTNSLRQYETRPYRVDAHADDGSVIDFTRRVAWSSSDDTIATVDAAGVVTARGVGAARIVATYGSLAASSTLSVLAARQDDLDVTYIQCTPRYNYDAAKNNPAPGDLVTFNGHIKNWDNYSPEVGYRWELDGIPVAYGTLSPMAPGEERVVTWQWNFANGPHQVKLIVDPNNLVPEASEVNNAIEDRTDGVIVGFWVEQSLYDYFHAHQRELPGVGSNSWEDWAQRQMAKWNEQNAGSIWPNTPQGVPDRVRIDEITIVPDGALPLAGGLAGNNPDLRDKTIDMMWGFPSSSLDGTFYANHTSKDLGNPFFLEPSLRHEMGHARYLIDNYTFDVANNSDVTQVQILEGGQPVAGTPLMPYLAFDSVLYYNQSGGLMTGPYGNNIWSPHEAGALARIAGRRAVAGNYNAPGNIGEYLNDLPQNNHVRFVDSAGNPLAGANVKVFAASPGPGYGGKIFDNSPEYVLTADTDGIIDLPKNPFIPGAMKELVFRVESNGYVWYRFFEVAEMNIAYQEGNTADALYTVELPNRSAPAEIEVQGLGQAIVDGDSTPTLDDLTDFGAANVNGGYVQRTFVIKNRGGLPLRLTGSPLVRISGPAAADFSVVYQPSQTITTETLTVFQIKFDPRAVGLRQATVTVSNNDSNEGSYDFKIQGTGDIPPAGNGAFGTKFNDRNGNGQRDDGEEGLLGWRIYSDANENEQFDPGEVSTLTDANGEYELGNLPVAANHIREVMQPGWKQTAPAEGFYIFNPGLKIPIRPMLFGNQRVPSVSGTIFGDRNLNHQFDTGEALLTATVYADLNENGSLDDGEPRSTGTGSYQLALDAGKTYTLRTVAPSGYIVSAPPGGVTSVNLADQDQVVDFGFWRSVPVRTLFYNNSSYDGNNAAPNEEDDNAIAPDKIGEFADEGLTFASLSSYTKGINGVILDLPVSPFGGLRVLTADDFEFRSGKGGDPSTWASGPAPISITLRPGAGVQGMDRVTLIWKDFNPKDTSPIAQAVANGRLQITVRATARTRLSEPSTFYFSSLIGDAADPDSSTAVTAGDLVLTRNAIGTQRGVITSPTDFNRDGQTNAADLVTVRNNIGHALTPMGPVGPPQPAVVVPWVQSTLFATRRLAFSSPLDRDDDELLLG